MTDAGALLAIVDRLPAVVAAWDADQRCLFANAAASHWWGRSRDDLIGRRMRELVGEAEAAISLPYVSDALAGRARVAERTLVDADGHLRHAQVTYCPFRTSGARPGCLTVITDITERVSAQVSRRAEGDRLNRLRERQQFAAGVIAVAGQRLQPVRQALAGLPRDPRGLEEATAIIDEVIVLLRQAIKRRQETTDVDRLVEAVNGVVAASDVALPFHPTVAVAGDLRALPGRVATAMLAALRHALHSVAGRPDVTQIDVTLGVVGEQAELRVIHDGRHPAENALPDVAAMRLEAELVGGFLAVSVDSRSGSVIEWCVPLAHDGAGLSLEPPSYDWHRPSALLPAAGDLTPEEVAAVWDGLPRAAAAAVGDGDFATPDGDTATFLVDVLDAIPAVVTVWDGDFRNLFANRTAVGWLGGATRDELRGQSIRRLLPREVYEANLPYAQATLRGAVHTFYRSVADQSGSLRHTQVAYLPRRVEDPAAGMVVMVTDVSELVRRDAELRARAGAAAALTTRVRIAEDLHDLVIQQLYAAELALAQADPYGGDDRDRSIAAAVERLDAAIADLARCSEELKQPINGVPGGLRSTIEAAVAGAAVSITPTVSVRAADDAAPPGLTRDLLAVLTEALSNVSRHANARHVEVAVSDDDRMLTLSITDDGDGMPARTSTGSGLPNMRRRAERYGGALLIVAREPHGTRLVWTVPLG